jgi:hypothetical protein
MNFFRTGKSPDQKREAATPMFSLRKTESPNTTIVPGSRLHSFNRSQDSTENFRSDFEALKKSYQRLLEENMTLRSEKSLNIGENSVSTVLIERDYDQIVQNYAGEVEELYGLISDSQDVIQKILDECSEINQEYTEIKQQYNHLKFIQDLQDYTKSVKINLVNFIKLQETLNKKVEEIKMMTRDKKRLEIGLKETETARKEAEGEIRVKEIRLKSLESSADSELLNTSELYYKLSMASSALALAERKAAKYEKYIQVNFKDKH